MKEFVLKFLRDQGKYASGEEISQKLGVTRASVWKIIKKLQAEGYTIQSSPRKGYRLVETPNVITREEVANILQTQLLGKNIQYYEEVDSTNNKAKEVARLGASEGTIILADKQTLGRGRLGRHWSSPAKVGIWMSIVLRPPLLPYQVSQLTLIAGVNMCEAIQEVTGLECKIKWPNDVVVNGKKVCGILTEMSAEMERINHIVVGIGVNVNHKSFPEELPHATSLAIEAKKDYSRRDIIKAFLEKFERDYIQYKENPTLISILPRYEASCITLNNRVRIIMNNEEFIAQAIKIGEQGDLIVRMDNGEEKMIVSGEVSVRGLYGYS